MTPTPMKHMSCSKTAHTRSCSSTRTLNSKARKLSPLTADPAADITVVVVTAANGGDNLGVYIPVFARQLTLIPVYATIFAVMTAVWCIVGRSLVTHRLVAATMQRAAAVLLPYVLIGLGLWILSDAIGLVMPASG